MSLFNRSFCVLLSWFCCSFAQMPTTEYNALYDLYNASSGDNWIWSENPQQDGIPWSFAFEADPCTDNWQGVICLIPDHVTELRLPRMHLSGSLTATLSDLVELEILQLPDNQLFGTIPRTFCTLIHLKELEMEGNRLTGSIPTCIGNLTAMHTLYLFHNKLDGSIPSGIVNMTKLGILDLGNNRLTGPLPRGFTDLVDLTGIRLDNNVLNGSIPNSIGRLTKLVSLHLDRNELSGTIPNSICNLTLLLDLYLSVNRLTGRIPQAIDQLVKMELIYLSGNRLTGPIPPSIGNLASLVSLLMSDNKLTGTIPSNVSQLNKLKIFSIGANALSGTVPEDIVAISTLQLLQLDYNTLTGRIPSAIGDLVNLQYFYLYTNHLTGSIPASIGDCSTLQNIRLGYNLFTGTLPPSLGNITTLINVALRNNYFVGSLDGVFSATQASLESIQLDDNQFSGTLPSVLFDLPSLITLSIVGSCIHGTLPANICQASQLEALILYGLTTGGSCRDTGVRVLHHAQHSFYGPFPTCLLGSPNLVTLLLSSNGFTGSIPSNTLVSHKLVQLDLSHNALSGTIPNVIQNHTWSLLDLSHNKLSGVLQSDLLLGGNVSLSQPVDQSTLNRSAANNDSSFLPDPQVSLSSNRLSGPVPASLMPLHNYLSVLAGNLFECRYDKSNLPSHDEDVSTYECASNTFDISVYVWLGMAVSAASMLGTVYYLHNHRRRLTSPTPPDWQLSNDLAARVTNVHQLLNKFDVLRKHTCYCGAFCTAVLLPYYAIMSQYAGTHTYQYAYVLSAIYTSGIAPFVCDVLLLIALLTAVYSCFTLLSRTPMPQLAASAAVHSTGPTRLARNLVWVVFTAINVTVVLGANIAFVYVVLYQSSQLQTLMQVLLSLFKIGWSSLAAPFLIRRLDVYFLPDGENAHAVEPFFVLQLLVALFNNIAIPCLVVAAIDPNCFSNILIPPDAQTVEYLLPSCLDAIAEGPCVLTVYLPTSLEFTPPFTYSYQCSASFITSYAPTFIYMSMSTVFLTPLLQYVLLQLHAHLPAESTARRVVLAMVPRILKPPSPETLPATVTDRRKFPIVGAVGLLVTLLTQLGILLTFGAIFPPVALAMAVSIAALVFMIRYKVERFVHAVVDTQQLPFLDVINAECERVGTREQMRVAVVIIICYCCTFYTLFLFDTLGDGVGFDASAWVLLVVPLTPLVGFGCSELYLKRNYNKKNEESRTEEAPQGASRESVLELSIVSVRSIDKDSVGLNDVANVLHDTQV